MFRTVIEENQKIWRYMKLKNFKEMLQDKALYFVRASKVEVDENEGRVPEITKKADEFIGRAFPSPVARDLEKGNQCHYKFQDDILREYVFIHCWRMDDWECSKAWHEYVGSDSGIVIQSTYSRFKECFRKENHEVFTGLRPPFGTGINPMNENPPEGIFIEPVEYFFKGRYPSFTLWYQCLLYYTQKDCKKFGWEKEIRALKFDDKFDKKYLPISTDIEILIEKIIVSPRMPKLQSEVKSLVSEHGLKVDVCKSCLNEY